MVDPRFTIAKLNGTNWQTWKVRLENLLSREDVWHAVAEEIPEEKSEKWKTADRRAKATLMLMLEDSQLSLVKRSVYARDAFNALKDYHQKATRSVRVSLLKKLCAMNMPDRGDLEQHLLEVDDLFERLDAAGTELDKDTKICMFLRSLPPSFDNLVTALDSRSDDDISLDVVKSRLMDEYHRRLEREGGSGSASKSEKAMRSAESVYGEKRVCHFCKKPGHIRRNCRKLLASKKDSESAPRYRREEKESAKAKAAHGDNKYVAFTVGNKNACWIIDSGASAHMTNDRSFFTSLKEFAGGWITLADGKKTQIQGEGCGVLYGVDGEDDVMKIYISEVKFVPGLSTSLISVAKLAQKKLNVSFDDEKCRIVDPKGVVVASGSRYGGLYRLRLAETSLKVTTEQHRENCQHQWHRRFGHRDWAATERIVKENLAIGMKVSDCGLRITCECCMEGKLARPPFPAVTERKSTGILDIVHTDLCGPMNTATPSGNRYVMNIIDDYSRFTVTYLLKNKWEAAESIKEYVRWVETLHGRKPKVIRSDGGGEFDNNQLRNFYRVEGIKPQFTTPYSPQQNGVAERKNRSLTEMATCMLLDSGLEKRFWGEATLTATYLQNRLPSRSVQKTPYELWWNRKPEVGHLKVFGSDAFVHIPEAKRGKMEGKARKLTFVGYSMEHKGYRFVDHETDRITVSRDARFIELGNGTISVECPASSGPEENDEDEIKLLPFKEKKDKSDAESADSEEFYEADEENGDVPATSRRSSRQNRGAVPKRFDDYVLDYAVGVAACAVEEPSNFREAVKIPEWRSAMEDELASHRRNETWELVPPPQGRKIVGSKWVFKVKRNEQDEVVKYKARLVAQGYTQQHGIDFDQVFAPVTRQATMRTFLALASKQNMVVRHLDVKTAYLYGSLDEEILMRQPTGCAVPGKEDYVCRLKRSIYGLRQSARCWHRRLNEALSKRGFKPSGADPCLYVKTVGTIRVFLLVYVDDMLIGSTDEREVKRLFDSLKEEFELTCLGEVRHFLGMEVQRKDGVYRIRLQNYIENMVAKFGMEHAKTAKSPMEPGFLKTDDSSEAFEDSSKYRSLVGGLLYIAVNARPDIAACTAILGRKFSAPGEADWNAAKRVLRYLKTTAAYSLQLGGEPEQALIGYADSDWAGDVGSRKSTSGFVFSYAGGVISWASRRQTSVTLSSMEAEYVALSEACQETVWLRQLLRDLGEEQKCSTVMHEDNQGCIAFVKTERSSRRSKHIDTKENFVKDLCEKKEIKLVYCPTDQMLADVLTKPLGPMKHQMFCDMLGLGSISEAADH